MTPRHRPSPADSVTTRGPGEADTAEALPSELDGQMSIYETLGESEPIPDETKEDER